MPKRKGDVTYDDNPACVEMHSLIQEGDARSPNHASYIVADLDWVQGKTYESRARRLRDKYPVWLAAQSSPAPLEVTVVSTTSQSSSTEDQGCESEPPVPEGLEYLADRLKRFREEAENSCRSDSMLLLEVQLLRAAISRERFEVVMADVLLQNPSLDLSSLDLATSMHIYNSMTTTRIQLFTLARWEELLTEIESTLGKRELARVLRLLLRPK
ncbi:MAG: hypothetical protein K0U98_05920 [Deltaproteobacteria bacterium]|nr:hypothetical protein [Deltaproteobacteria bacterium]